MRVETYEFSDHQRWCVIQSIRLNGSAWPTTSVFAIFPDDLINQQFIPPINVLLSICPHPMNANGFLSFLLSLSIRSQRALSPLSPWRVHLETLAHSTFLRLWRLYKFAYRAITGQGAIERLCQYALKAQTSKVDVREIEFDTREVRNVIWRIGSSSLRKWG